MFIGAIILYIFDQSSFYYGWPFYVFGLASLIAFASLIYGIIYIRKHQSLSDTMSSTIEWMRFMSMSLMIILMIFMFFISSATVYKSSMNPTLSNGDVVLVYHYTYTPKRNDVVIANVNTETYPNHQGAQDFYVKRIYGVPGDIVTFQYVNATTYKILINGNVVTNQYDEIYYAHINSDINYMTFSSYSEKAIIEASLDDDNQLKEGRYLLFGDNQDDSIDSRDLGAFYQEDIVGKVLYKISPFGGIS